MKKHTNNLIALLITIIFTLIVLHKVDFGEMASTFKEFNYVYLLLLIPFFILIMTLRAKRWKILLPKNDCGFYNLYEIYMTSNLLNVFLPARAGDIFRGCYFGHKYNLSKLNVLGTVAAERILDGLTVIVILLSGIILYNKSAFAVKLAVAASVLFISGFIFAVCIYKYNKIDEICDFVKKNTLRLPFHKKLCSFIDNLNPKLNAFIRGFETFNSPKLLANAIFFSIFSWAGDCVFIYLLVLAFGIKASFIMTFFIVSFIALSTIIPSSSMYVGLYQYAFILAMALFGVEKSPALSISLVQQGIMLAAYLIIAGVFVFRKHIKFSDYKEK